MHTRLVATIAAAALACAGCGFDRASNVVAPSAPPDLSSIPDGGVGGTLTGVWASPPIAGIPAGTNCYSFQWRINSQTDNSLVGEFYATCSNGIVVAGVASGQLNGDDVSIQVSGTGTLPGVLSCPFTLNGTGHIEGDAMPLQYAGTTCFGPVQGQETLRRPSPAEPEPPPPPPPPPPPDPVETNPYHVGPGPNNAERAEQVVMATAEEFEYLRTPRASHSERIAVAEELLLRIIWHLQLAGFEAGRQRNPSTAISNDKVTIVVDGVWRVYDLFVDYDNESRPIDVIFFETAPPNSVATPGIPD